MVQQLASAENSPVPPIGSTGDFPLSKTLGNLKTINMQHQKYMVMENIKLILLLPIIVYLSACAIIHEQKTTRTLILDGKQFKENKPGEFTSWKCNDYSYGGKTLVEVGKIPYEYLKQISGNHKKKDDFLLKIIGFVLYDGTNKGDVAFYKRRGINHRWDWGSEGKYSFIIKPDGTGLFYDFSNTKKGEKIKADDVYKCKQ